MRARRGERQDHLQQPALVTRAGNRSGQDSVGLKSRIQPPARLPGGVTVIVGRVTTRPPVRQSACVGLALGAAQAAPIYGIGRAVGASKQ